MENKREDFKADIKTIHQDDKKLILAHLNINSNMNLNINVNLNLAVTRLEKQIF